MLVPVGGGPVTGGFHLFPRVKMASRESQGVMGFPPRFDEVQVGATHWLENELEARVGQTEQQHIIGAMGIQVVQYDVNPLDGGVNPLLDGLQQVEKDSDGAPP